MHEKIIEKAQLKRFLRLLKENNAYFGFFRALKKDEEFCRNCEENYIKYFNSICCQKWLLGAFYFDKQVEGFEFWRKINKKWKYEI